MNKWLIHGVLNINDFVNKEVPRVIRNATATVWFSFSSRKDADEWLEKAIQTLNELDWKNADEKNITNATDAAIWLLYSAKNKGKQSLSMTKLWENIIDCLSPKERAGDHVSLV